MNQIFCPLLHTTYQGWARVPVEPSRPAFLTFVFAFRVPAFLYEVFFSVPKFAFPRSRVPGQNNFPNTVKKKLATYTAIRKHTVATAALEV